MELYSLLGIPQMCSVVMHCGWTVVQKSCCCKTRTEMQWMWQGGFPGPREHSCTHVDLEPVNLHLYLAVAAPVAAPASSSSSFSSVWRGNSEQIHHFGGQTWAQVACQTELDTWFWALLWTAVGRVSGAIPSSGFSSAFVSDVPLAGQPFLLEKQHETDPNYDA